MSTFSIWQRTVQAVPDLEVDIAVVGGGITGVSTAYWLGKQNPDLRIVLIEARKLGAGASGRNAGFLLQGATGNYQQDVDRHGKEAVQRLWAWTRENRDSLLAEFEPSAFLFEDCGSLTVAGDATEDAQLQSSAPSMVALGYEAEYWDADKVNAHLRSRGFRGGLYLATNGALHPARLVHHIVERSTAQVLIEHPVERVESGTEGIQLHTPLRCISARRAVFALNAYLPLLFPSLSAYVRPVRAQMMATAPLYARWLKQPVYSDNGFYYLRQDLNGRLLLGGARHLHEHEERGYVDETTEAVQADLRAYLNRHFPEVKEVKTVMQWSGVMGFSLDHLPMIGQLSDHPGSWWVGGFTGHGMAFGFRTGKLMAECIMGTSEPEGLDLFDVKRFDR